MDALINLNQTWQGEQVMNVIGFNNVIDDLTFLGDLADGIRSAFDFYATSHLSTAWSLDSLTVNFISGGEISYSVEVDFALGVLAGTVATDVVASQNCLLVSTSYRGAKPNRGRIYFCGLTEASLNNGVWDSPVVASFVQMVESWINGLPVGAAYVYPLIVSRPTLTRPTYVSNPVESAVGRGRVATQRRRRLSG